MRDCMVEKHSYDRQLFFIRMLQIFLVGSGLNSIHFLNHSHFFHTFHKQIDWFYRPLCLGIGQLDTFICFILKAAGITLSDSIGSLSTLFQKLPLAFTVLLDRRDAGFNFQKIVFEKIGHKLLLQKYISFTLRDMSGYSVTFVGIVQTKHFFLRRVKHLTGFMQNWSHLCVYNLLFACFC